MNTTNVHEMSDDELRREIAERLGWEIYALPAIPKCVGLRGPDGHRIDPVGGLRTKEQAGELWIDAMACDMIPNWPVDIGAAIELCMSVLDRLNERNPGEWTLEIADSVCLVADSAGGIWQIIGIGTEGRDARALSELALMALREMGEGDE